MAAIFISTPYQPSAVRRPGETSLMPRTRRRLAPAALEIVDFASNARALLPAFQVEYDELVGHLHEGRVDRRPQLATGCPVVALQHEVDGVRHRDLAEHGVAGHNDGG